MFDIITFGSATQDIMIKPKKLTVLKYEKGAESSQEVCFPMGSKIDVEDIKFLSGGGGTNTAATFALQGFATAFCGMMGDDIAGKEIIDELKAMKINTSLVQKIKEKPTNHSVIILNDGRDRTILAYRGASELMGREKIPWNKLKTRWLYLAPLTGLLCDTFSDIVDFAKQNDITVAANPSLAQLSLKNFTDIAKKLDILVLNQEEASFLTKIPLENEHEIFHKIDEICPGVVVMTKGEAGVVVSDGEYVYRSKPVSVREVVDTTGAGDSFSSGFVTGYINGHTDIEGAIQLGMANSRGCISKIGAKNGLLKKGDEFEEVLVLREECDNNVCIVK